MKDGLYHKDVGLPKGLEIKPIFGLRVGYHAKQRALELNVRELPSHFLPSKATVVEVEVIQGRISKIVARQSLDNSRDLCFAFLVDERLIKTFWINSTSDKHYTLDKSRFVRP